MESISNFKSYLDGLYEEYVQNFNPALPDPIFVAKKYKDEKIALFCALFAYGSAKQIVKFLETIDFALLEASEKEIQNVSYYYRFQKSMDVAQFLITLKRANSLEEVFYQGYKNRHSIVDGLSALIGYLQSLNSYQSYGYNFLLGKPPKSVAKAGAYKRYNMFLRWMVRRDAIDMGLWQSVAKSDLLMPLDTHTFNVAKRFGLLQRKSCDLLASVELTNRLKEYDAHDPVKYDFALYRIGQLGLI